MKFTIQGPSSSSISVRSIPLSAFKSSNRLQPGCLIRLTVATAVLFLFPLSLPAQAKRIVVIKVDGLPGEMVDRFVRETDPRTGKSQLPWFDQVFYRGGTRIANFYVRGISLSAPSWSLLDTGQHLNIKGNVEFDRYTLNAYDYLNFIPFYLNNALQRRIDMPGPQVLDDQQVPLFIDSFANDARYQSFQPFQRAIRWTTLQNGLKARASSLGPREIVDEWTTGFEIRNIFEKQQERELIERLNNPNIRYLDYFANEFDHTAHRNSDDQSLLLVLKNLDALIGRIWTAIENSKEADSTALIIVSDHGFNIEIGTYSQGFNLVKLLGSPEGGGHHAVTKRRLLMNYAIKGLNPIVPYITTTTNTSYYLKGQSSEYPTALLDLDGNERASIHLRDNDLNLLQILFQQLKRRELPLQTREAATRTFFATIDRRRAEWVRTATELREELDSLQKWIDAQRPIVEALPRKWDPGDQAAGKERAARRIQARYYMAIDDKQAYSRYLVSLEALLALKSNSFRPEQLNIATYLAKGAMGDQNSIRGLRNYIVGLSDAGLVLNSDSSLDLEKSFKRIDYFNLLKSRTVLNNVQPNVGNRPIDFIARRVPGDLIKAAMPEEPGTMGDAVWLYAGEQSQAIVLSTNEPDGTVNLKYTPVAHLIQGPGGEISFDMAELRPGLPLQILEDPNLNTGGVDAKTWLEGWHSDVEWLRALHRTRYSNGVIGVNEQVARHDNHWMEQSDRAPGNDELLIRRFRSRQRNLVEPDMQVVAANHWNFDVRGFNPGGNHGSFFRVSTHATLMIAGGEQTAIPRGMTVEEPYDSLSLTPTLFALLGELKDGNEPVQPLYKMGYRRFPGRVIREAVRGTNRELRGTVAGTNSPPE
jgi:hypothetical protein